MIQSLKGMPDLLPVDTLRWQQAEHKLRRLFESYGFGEIRTPFLEPTELFSRSVGESTDIVEKEMYTFIDKNGESITLRPEGTASVVRAYNQNNLAHLQSLWKLYYLGPMFRHERPQKGRYRQFYQVGAEVIGSMNPLVDVEVIQLLYEVGKAFDIESPLMQINSVGDATCRMPYREKLVSFLGARKSEFCETCQKRIDANPMRVLDCKNPNCQALLETAPMMLDHLCDPCKDHFSKVTRALDTSKIPYVVNKKIVRGLDYYTKTAFEMTGGGLGAQNTVGAGGRYDNLIEETGGKPTPAIGFAIGMERLLLSSRAALVRPVTRIDVIPLDTPQAETAFLIANRVRQALGDHAVVTTLLDQTSFKSALRLANKNESTYVLILGENELQKNTIMLKNLRDHTQKEVTISDIENVLMGEFNVRPA